MASLYVANVNFESTGNTQIVYSANSVTFKAGGNTILVVNSTAISNGTNISLPAAAYTIVQVIVNTAIVNNSLTDSGAVIYNGNVTPAALAANTADYAPGVSNVYSIRVSGNNSTVNSEYIITGMTAGTNGQLVMLENVDAMGIWIRNEEAGSNGAFIPGVNIPGSTAANRFNLPNHFKLQGYQSATFYYDGILSRWRLTDSSTIPFDYKSLLTKGFFSGGAVPACAPPYNVTTANRTTYSSETTAAVPGANLSQARDSLSAAGNVNKGFFSGGCSCALVATTDRTTYSTETTAAVPGANLSQGRQGLAAAGNACKGFFSGGTTPTLVATADRTTYSTETTAAVPGANLSQARTRPGAAGNVDKGFFSGGTTPTLVATADRTIYSTEVTAAVPGANLSQARYGLGAAGNACKGFFAGGCTSTSVATADRTTYSSETTAAVPGANLSQARSGLGAAGNACKGFFSGGQIPTAPTYLATADRTTYSTETTAAVPGANLSQARSSLGAA